MLVKLSYKESWLCWLQLSFKPESCLPGEWVKEQDGWFLILLLFYDVSCRALFAPRLSEPTSTASHSLS